MTRRDLKALGLTLVIMATALFVVWAGFQTF